MSSKFVAFGIVWSALFLGGLVPLFIAIYAGRQQRRRLEHRLAFPEIDGIPLPAIHDPRWKWVDEYHTPAAVLGDFWVGQAGNIYLRAPGGRRHLGEFPQYAQAIAERIRPDSREQLLAIAQKSIEEAE